MSSAGLIYKHFGSEIIENIIEKILSSEKLDIVIQNTSDL